jgi:N utilization substance protein A
VTTVEALADMTPEQLEAIEGIGPKTVEKISLAVNNYFASLEQGEAVAVEGVVEGEVATEGVAVEGEAPAEEAAPEGAAETAGDEVAADGVQAAAPESKAEAEPASNENEEHEPKAGSAPETIE